MLTQRRHPRAEVSARYLTSAALTLGGVVVAVTILPRLARGLRPKSAHGHSALTWAQWALISIAGAGGASAAGVPELAVLFLILSSWFLAALVTAIRQAGTKKDKESKRNPN